MRLLTAKLYGRNKYAYKSCEGVESDGGAAKTAELPPQIIPQGIATPGLLSYIITSKFTDALPFYRQEKIFRRLGVELSRATMANWCTHVAQNCNPLMKLLYELIKSGPVINTDETTVQVMKEPGRSDKTKSYMWAFRGGEPEKPVLIYNITEPEREMCLEIFYQDIRAMYKLAALPDMIALNQWTG
ncbi:MAG: IS66 family transposase [Nitrospirae bacterium YQR-1]